MTTKIKLYGWRILGSAVAALLMLSAQPAHSQTLGVLYSFGALANDGFTPTAGVIRDSAGNLYGTTYNGGTYGYGCVYKITATRKESVLYSFTGGKDGNFPNAALLRDTANNLYGTTAEGGTYGGGTVFKLDTTGKETVLYSFGATPTDGFFPLGSYPRCGGKLLRSDL